MHGRAGLNGLAARAQPGATAAVGRLEPIDVLRGVAAIGVFAFHLTLLVGFDKRVLPPIMVAGHAWVGVPNVFAFGATGVSLFFVISGFCLALQQWRKSPSFRCVPLGDYARNRVARIVPTYWAAVLASAIVAVGVGRSSVGAAVGQAVIHFFFLHGFSGDTVIALNGALWSMATEVQFYLLFPLLAAIYARFGGVRFVSVAVMAQIAVRCAVEWTPGLHRTVGQVDLSSLIAMQIPGRFLEFCLGMLLADLYVNRWDAARRAFKPLLAVVLFPALYLRMRSHVLPDIGTGVLYVCLIGALLSTRSYASARALHWAAAFGRSSYSFFVTHMIVFELLGPWLPRVGGPYSMYLIDALVLFPTCLAVGAVFYRCVELPCWTRLRVASRLRYSVSLDEIAPAP